MNTGRSVVIVAGGTGSRMHSALPKQFLMLAGKPLLMHTISAFEKIAAELIIVMHRDYISHWEALCRQFNFETGHKIVKGATSRGESVFNGLKEISENGFVAIHDAARPLLTSALASRLFTEAEEFGNAVPVVPVRDSIRQVNEAGNFSVNREDYVMVQTPQVFMLQEILECFKSENDHSYSDEASLYESKGGIIHLSAGEPENIKITINSDILLAESLIAARTT